MSLRVLSYFSLATCQYRFCTKTRNNSIRNDWVVAAALTGTVLGAEAHVWYRFLDRFIAQTTWTSVFKKVCLDQTIAAPIYTGTYIIGTSLLEGRTTVNELQTDMKRNFVPLYLADCVIYIPTQMINFKYVSPYFRVPFMFAVSFIFNAFLSAFKHRSDDDH